LNGLLSVFLTQLCGFVYSRVQVEVLKAIALKVQKPDVSAFCVANVSKPYLSVGPPKGGRTTFKYVEAVESYCELLTNRDLVRAYEWAGTRFTGTLFLLVLFVLVLIFVCFPREPHEDFFSFK